MTPGRSLSAKTSGCSIVPVADDVPRGADLVQRVALPDRARGRRRSRARARGRGSRRPRRGPAAASARARSWPPSASSAPPGSTSSSHEHDVGAQPRRRASAAARPAIPPPMTSTSQWRRRYSVRHSRSSCCLRQPPEPGGVAQDLLVERPQAARADERLVVEARRRERAADDVGRPHHVEVERRPRVLVLDRHARRATGSAHARTPGRAVDGDERVRALPAAAQLAARAVVLERARERAPAGGEQRGGDRVALVARRRACRRR